MPCKKIKRKREKDQKTVALGLDIITWISSLGYHHLDIITYGVATTISSHLPTDCLPTGILTAYSVQHQTRPDQTRPVQIKKIKK
jgi:hypothetical protein